MNPGEYLCSSRMTGVVASWAPPQQSGHSLMTCSQHVPIDEREGSFADRTLNRLTGSVVKRRLPSGYGVCVIKDVSEQKKREEQWRLDTERVQVTEEVLDNLPFPISVKDRNSTFVAVNKANCDFLDLPADAILGHKGSDINSKAFEDRLTPINQHVYETGDPIQLPEHITRPDGSTALTIVHK